MNRVTLSFRITTWNRTDFIGYLVNTLGLLYCLLHFPDRIGFSGSTS